MDTATHEEKAADVHERRRTGVRGMVSGYQGLAALPLVLIALHPIAALFVAVLILLAAGNGMRKGLIRCQTGDPPGVARRWLAYAAAALIVLGLVVLVASVLFPFAFFDWLTSAGITRDRAWWGLAAPGAILLGYVLACVYAAALARHADWREAQRRWRAARNLVLFAAAFVTAGTVAAFAGNADRFLPTLAILLDVIGGLFLLLAYVAGWRAFGEMQRASREGQAFARPVSADSDDSVSVRRLRGNGRMIDSADLPFPIGAGAAPPGGSASEPGRAHTRRIGIEGADHDDVERGQADDPGRGSGRRRVGDAGVGGDGAGR